jgi:GDP/UDP-N,N'-diacetylbacillosamine 2-epimerase (hydrolysing)
MTSLGDEIGDTAVTERTAPLRLLLVTGTRADFGLWQPVIAEARRRPDSVAVKVLVGGMHLDDRFGSTVSEVRAAGVEIAAEVPFTPPGDSPAEMAASLGSALEAMAPAISRDSPDWILLLGDRGEQLAAALAALHLSIPIAHLHGGERSLGAIDDTMRDMISRTAHLHFVANREACERLERMGEASWRIQVVGAPGLDGLAGQEPAGRSMRRRYGLPIEGDYLVVMQHPETVGRPRALADLEAVLRGVARSGLPALAIGPNSDAGGRAMLRRLQTPGGSRVTTRASVPRNHYVALLAGATALVGNSSSGLIEAPLLGVPTINVGDRQKGRTRGDNVIEVPADADAVTEAIRRARQDGFRDSLSRTSPYGDGHAAPRIIDALIAQPIDARLLVKEVGV